jgi:hypothetical protein
MKKVIASEFVSLDGVIENPVWTLRFTGEEQHRFKYDDLSAADALLLGRATYEGFAAAWPHMTEQAGEYADMMNGYLKLRSLDDPGATSRVEQLDADKGRRRRGGTRAKAATRWGHHGLRQRQSREQADAPQPHRRVPAHGSSPWCWAAGSGSSGTASRRPSWNSWALTLSTPASSSSPTDRRKRKLKNERSHVCELERGKEEAP